VQGINRGCRGTCVGVTGRIVSTGQERQNMSET